MLTPGKKLNASIAVVCDPSSASLGVTVYQILPYWRELVLQIYSLSLEYIDSVAVVLCTEWKIFGFRRTSMDSYLLPVDLSVAPNSTTRMY